jgi:hypothetical protein
MVLVRPKIDVLDFVQITIELRWFRGNKGAGFDVDHIEWRRF